MDAEFDTDIRLVRWPPTWRHFLSWQWN